MKLLTCTLLLLAMGITGCTLDTPAYSSKELFAQISRNAYAQQLQIPDDIDHMLLLRPSGQLTMWNIYHRE